MNTNIEDRKTIFPRQLSDLVTVYSLEINDHIKITKFLTIDKAEAGIKAVEVLQDNEEVTISYKRYKTTFAEFKKELQGLI